MSASDHDLPWDIALAQGNIANGIALLELAAESGNVDALYRHAALLLAGERVARNVARARELLRRAVAIGHVDAALLEIAFTANGSGGPASWAKALTLLEVAAQTDPVAAHQLKLIGAMKLDPEGKATLHPQSQSVSSRPDVQLFTAFLTPDECAHVARTASELLEPALVVDPANGRRISHPFRSSDAATIGPPHEDLVIRAINQRIAALTGTRVEQGEALAVLRYNPGQEFRMHLDTITGAANQRVMTVLVYLNQGFAGGETVFPDAGLTITPRAGDAVMFCNILPDGTVDERTRHAELSVTRGKKWLATRWIRAQPIDPWSQR
jgi:prolyl 4-hydroxylase